MKKVVNYIIAFAAGYKFASRKTKGPRYQHKVEYKSIRGSSSAVSEFIDIWKYMSHSEKGEITVYINECVDSYCICTIKDVDEKFNLGMSNITDNWGWKRSVSRIGEVIDDLGFINWEELR